MRSFQPATFCVMASLSGSNVVLADSPSVWDYIPPGIVAPVGVATRTVDMPPATSHPQPNDRRNARAGTTRANVLETRQGTRQPGDTCTYGDTPARR